MKIKAHKNKLHSLVRKVQGALGEKSLAHIALRASEGKLHLSAADRVVAIYVSTESSIEKAGDCFVAAKLFSDVVRELPNEDICLEAKDSFLVIRSLGQTRFQMKLPLISGLKWPKAPELDEEAPVVSLPSDRLAYMLEQGGFCIAQESPRNYASVGFLHTPTAGELRLVGTDGFRLSYCSVKAEALPKGFLGKGITLSKRALSELLKLCYEPEGKVSLSISSSGSTALAEVENYRVYILLSAVKYPNYRSVLPKKLTKKVQVSRPVMQAVARRLLLAADKTRALLLSFSDLTLKLSSKTLGSTEGHENIEIKGYTGDSCELALNGKYLTDIFSNAASDNLVISFASEDDAVSFAAEEEPEGCVSEHILVPIRESK